MANTYLHDLIQTGDLYENVPCMPGHHETPETAIKCLCCGKDAFFKEKECVCRYVSQWYQDEKRRVTCQLHMAEKVKDGIFAV